MDSFRLGLLVTTGPLAIAMLIAVGTTLLARFKVYRALFRYIGWPLFAVVIGAVYYTLLGICELRFVPSRPLYLLGLSWGVISLLVEVVMASRLIVFLSGATVERGKVYVPADCLLDRALHWRWCHPYHDNNSVQRNLCQLTWLMGVHATLGLAVELIYQVLRGVFNGVTIFFTGRLVKIKKDGDPYLARRVVGFAPIVLLLASGLLAWVGVWLFAFLVGRGYGLAPYIYTLIFGGLTTVFFVAIALQYREAKVVARQGEKTLLDRVLGHPVWAAEIPLPEPVRKGLRPISTGVGSFLRVVGESVQGAQGELCPLVFRDEQD